MTAAAAVDVVTTMGPHLPSMPDVGGVAVRAPINFSTGWKKDVLFVQKTFYNDEKQQSPNLYSMNVETIF